MARVGCLCIRLIQVEENWTLIKAGKHLMMMTKTARQTNKALDCYTIINNP